MYSSTSSRGVAIFVKDSFSRSEIPIQTDLQAAAVKLFYPIKFIICCFYLPVASRITYTEIENQIRQFDCPFMLVGDFNCHIQLWGSNTVDTIRKKLLSKPRENALLGL